MINTFGRGGLCWGHISAVPWLQIRLSTGNWKIWIRKEISKILSKFDKKYLFLSCIHSQEMKNIWNIWKQRWQYFSPILNISINQRKYFLETKQQKKKCNLKFLVTSPCTLIPVTAYEAVQDKKTNTGNHVTLILLIFGDWEHLSFAFSILPLKFAILYFVN